MHFLLTRRSAQRGSRLCSGSRRVRLPLLRHPQALQGSGSAAASVVHAGRMPRPVRASWTTATRHCRASRQSAGGTYGLAHRVGPRLFCRSTALFDALPRAQRGSVCRLLLRQASRLRLYKGVGAERVKIGGQQCERSTFPSGLKTGRGWAGLLSGTGPCLPTAPHQAVQ